MDSWEKKKNKRKETMKRYYEKHKEQCLEKSKQYYQAHKETLNTKAKERYAMKKDEKPSSAELDLKHQESQEEQQSVWKRDGDVKG
jgi:hypothetical protein